jgi:Copper binding periplasmic protein CusF
LTGTNPLVAAYLQRSENREISMKLARMMLAGAMLVAVPSMTLAQQSLNGTITRIDRLNGTIAIRQAQSGTVGANGGGATEQQFKAPTAMLETVHAGDRIAFSVSETGGNKTITKIDRE